ncbi:hypothetical protein K437DRAFT_164530 [Tilletiaria anomala UBC 951]|uniref:Uncharacterized protein n=1 Tax=Tilletiaria anomala (strain ATCC 24038 / CBS 436.72 / UBC 951) TaxID=1037660 RepID=A0A066VUD3_TILAU|nr:uncharacterized protein K437DRAFT_164530 [Tilletiaria anomala UBC 951]KDN42404.1 hypothetical protein K437DRAFT_164530 [Tilletiaria anomala UBC 951]
MATSSYIKRGKYTMQGPIEMSPSGRVDARRAAESEKLTLRIDLGPAKGQRRGAGGLFEHASPWLPLPISEAALLDLLRGMYLSISKQQTWSTLSPHSGAPASQLPYSSRGTKAQHVLSGVYHAKRFCCVLLWNGERSGYRRQLFRTRDNLHTAAPSTGDELGPGCSPGSYWQVYPIIGTSFG